MLGHAKRTIEEYKPLVTKMAMDASKESTTKKNLSMLLDEQNMLALSGMMPIVHYVNSLFKFAHSPT